MKVCNRSEDLQYGLKFKIWQQCLPTLSRLAVALRVLSINALSCGGPRIESASAVASGYVPTLLRCAVAERI